MQLFFLAFILNPLIVIISTYFFPFIFGRLYKSTLIFGILLTLLWLCFSLYGIDIDSYFTFDGEYYYERLFNCLNYNSCQIGIEIRNFGFDIFLKNWYSFLSYIGLLNINDSNFYIFLQINVLLGILTINIILDIKNKYIGSFFDKKNIFLLSCPLFICFSLQLDREILIAFLVSLMIKMFIKKQYIFTFIFLLFLIPLRPVFFIILVFTFLIYVFFKFLRKFLQTRNISLKILLPILIIFFISITSYIILGSQNDYFLRVFLNKNNSGLTLFISNLPFLIRSTAYVILSFFTPFINFQALNRPDPIDFILSFTGLWNLTLFIYVFLNRFKFKISNYLDKDFIYPVFLCLIFSIFTYQGLLFNVRHSVQFYPILFLFLYLLSFNNSRISNLSFVDKFSQKSLITSFGIALAIEIPLSILI